MILPQHLLGHQHFQFICTHVHTRTHMTPITRSFLHAMHLHWVAIDARKMVMILPHHLDVMRSQHTAILTHREHIHTHAHKHKHIRAYKHASNKHLHCAAIDTREMPVVLTHHLVVLEVPALDHLVLGHREQIRVSITYGHAAHLITHKENSVSMCVHVIARVRVCACARVSRECASLPLNTCGVCVV